GFIAALLFFTVFSAFYRFFIFRRGGALTINAGVRILAAGGVFCVFLGFCLSLTPLSGVDVLVAGSLLQSLGIINFEIALFLTAFLPDHGFKCNKSLLGVLIAGGLLGILLPLGLPLGSAYILGCFSGLMTLLSVFFVRISQGPCSRNYLVTGIEFLLLTASFFIPFPMPQILIWTGVIAFFPIADSLILFRERAVSPGGAGPMGDIFIQNPDPAEGEKGEPEEEDPILPEKADQVSHAINPFIPREFLDILNKETVMDLQLGDHIKQEMTIFFSDIRQFTDLSENLTPEESFKFINSYLSRIVPEITEKGGFVDKYIGDAILALYPQASGADMAVRTAIAIQKRILEYNIHRASCGYRPLSMGIGVHTGTLMLGVVGVEGRMQNTVISDAVNLASRLESITKFFNVSMAISEQTFKKLADPGAYMYRFIGKVRVKGKSEPVSVFEIFDGIKSDIMERKMKANTYFEQGMLSYYQKEFGEALINFRKVLDILPEDGAALFYMQNCLAKIKIAQL
ncbi:MAG: adenylate/guanylate cyclase domain-containing protein, partial [Treponema sp.]|nr:adenylate/guanylate cyclase domain-containing protein [Treponema sp.]